MPGWAANSLIRPTRKHLGTLRSKVLKRDSGTVMPALSTTPLRGVSSRIAAKEPIGFAPVFGLNDRESTMPARRKPAHSRKTASKTAAKTTARKASPKRWSQRVTRESDALDLKRGVFTLRDPKRIAASLKRSAERSSRRKTGAYRSALSMRRSISTAPARPCRKRSASRCSAPRAS
jgi:Protein of unknown function (DUF3175)